MVPRGLALLANSGVGSLRVHAPVPSGTRPIDRSASWRPKPFESAKKVPKPLYRITLVPLDPSENPVWYSPAPVEVSHHTSKWPWEGMGVLAGKVNLSGVVGVSVRL